METSKLRRNVLIGPLGPQSHRPFASASVARHGHYNGTPNFIFALSR
jgi:hypothetical protein